MLRNKKIINAFGIINIIFACFLIIFFLFLFSIILDKFNEDFNPGPAESMNILENIFKPIGDFFHYLGNILIVIGLFIIWIPSILLIFGGSFLIVEKKWSLIFLIIGSLVFVLISLFIIYIRIAIHVFEQNSWTQTGIIQVIICGILLVLYIFNIIISIKITKTMYNFSIPNEKSNKI